MSDDRDITSLLRRSTLHNVAADETEDLRLEVERLTRELAVLRAERDALAADAARYRYLTEDLPLPQRAHRNELLMRMAVMSYSAVSADIDAALAEGADATAGNSFNAFVRRDAERYRYLRQPQEHCAVYFEDQNEDGYTNTHYALVRDELDRAVDAAMDAEGAAGPREDRPSGAQEGE